MSYANEMEQIRLNMEELRGDMSGNPLFGSDGRPGDYLSTPAGVGGAKAQVTPSTKRRSQRSHFPQSSHFSQTTVVGGQPNLSEAPLQLTEQLSAFLGMLTNKKVSTDAQAVLLANGVDSMEALEALHLGDLQALNLQLGQRRLLESLLFPRVGDGKGATISVNQGAAGKLDTSKPAETTSLPPAGKQVATGASSGGDAGLTANVQGALNTDIFLGLGIQGSQKQYYDIVDFLPKRSPYDVSPEGKTVIVQREDGSLAVEPNGAKEKALEKVSWPMWTEANMQIMAKLMGEGVKPQDYMTYTVIISQLAQKYEWSSVLIYDREYRKKQANSGRPWGSDIPILRDVTLVPKSNFSRTLGKGFENSSKQGKRGWGRGAPSSDSKPSGKGPKKNAKLEFQDKFKVCKAFNEGECRFGDGCRFHHVCTVCGAKTHGEAKHPSEAKHPN
jgi:hypothetical protein